MKQLDNYIQEKLKLNNEYKEPKYSCQPKDKKELIEILKERLSKNVHADLNDIDVSQIKYMNLLFNHKWNPCNIKIDQWDMSNVEDTRGMFYKCRNFNCDLSNWDVSNIKLMGDMFIGCSRFKGEGLEKWNPKNCNDMTDIFKDCVYMNVHKNIPSWYKK